LTVARRFLIVAAVPDSYNLCSSAASEARVYGTITGTGSDKVLTEYTTSVQYDSDGKNENKSGAVRAVLFHDLLHVILVILFIIIVIHRCIRVRRLRRIQLRHALRLDLRA
jgi:hypothetical protein